MRHIRAHLWAVCASIVLLAAGPGPARATEVQRVVSPGGIEALLVEYHDVPVIAVRFAFRGGFTTDAEGGFGRANLVSFLLDEGAGDLDSQAFQQALADNSVGLGFSDSADSFSGEFYIATRYADIGFELLTLALNEPNFDPEPVERMRRAAIGGIRQVVSGPGWPGWRAFYDLAFAGHPYGNASRGTVDSVEGLTEADFRAFVDSRFSRDNLLIGVAGDITAEELGARLDQVFGDLPATGAEPHVLDRHTLLGGGERVLVRRPGVQASLIVAQPGLDRTDPDFMTAVVLNYILGGGSFSSRLTDALRAERGLTYGVSSSLSSWRYANMLTATSQLSNENVGEALEVTLQIWRDIADQGVTEAEVTAAKDYLIGSYPLQFTDTDSVASMLLGIQLHELGDDYFDRRNGLIAAVTPADVNRVARELLDPGALTVIVTGDPPADQFTPTRTLDAAALVARELGESP